MVFVRIENNIVAEILPPETYGDIAYWYGADFAAQCIQAPDDVAQGMVYGDGQFSPAPPEPVLPLPPDPLADLDALTLDHEFRLILLEMGVF